MIDVLVVGASLAGATTALELASLGYRVRLIDRAAFPRRKACGEGLFPTGIRVLDKLGILTELRGSAAVVNSLSMTAYGATARADFADGRGGLGVRRELLDVAILRQAEARGVEVELGVNALGLIPEARPGRFKGVLTDKGEMEARVIVAADGLGSRLRRAAGLQRSSSGRRYGVSAHYEAGDVSGVEVHFRPGYEVYVTPVGDGLVNVAVLLGSDLSRRLGGRLGSEFDALARSGAPILDGARQIDDALAAGPFPSQARRRWQGNVVLAGDAAGFYDGIAGEGMSLALAGAVRCAAAIDAYLRDGQEAHFRAYDKAVVAIQRPSTLLARLCLALAARPALGRRVMLNLARKPDVFARLVATSQGETRLSSLRPRDAIGLLCGI